MKIYRYMKFEELKDICENHMLKFLRPTVWEDSLEGLFIKSFYNKESCQNLIETYMDSYYSSRKEAASISDVRTDLTNILLLLLPTYCKCFTVSNSCENYQEYNGDVFVEFEFSNTDNYTDKYKITGKEIQYIEGLNLDYIINYFNEERRLSDLVTHKDNSYSWEKEYRLSVLPMQLNHISYNNNTDNLSEYLVNYYNFINDMNCFKENEIQISNTFLKIVSIKCNPDLSKDLQFKIKALCEKHSITII